MNLPHIPPPIPEQPPDDLGGFHVPLDVPFVAPKPKSTFGVGPFIGTVAALIFIVWVVSRIVAAPDLPARDRTSRYAYLAGREFCRQALQAPSTAKFSSGDIGRDREAYLEGEFHNGVWVATGFVDAQNLFGAMLRKRWIAHVDKDELGNWRLRKLYLGEEKLYPPD